MSSEVIREVIRGHQFSSPPRKGAAPHASAIASSPRHTSRHPSPKTCGDTGGGGAVVSTGMLLRVVLSTCMLMGSTVEGSASCLALAC